MKRTKLIGLGILMVLFTGFMSYYCYGHPRPNNVSITKSCEINSSGGLQTSNDDEGNKIKKTGGTYKKADASGKSAKEATTPKAKNTEDRCIGPEVYLCEIAGFYKFIIGLMSTLVFIIMGLIFFYSIKISKDQAQEEAFKVFESDNFNDKVNARINELFITLKNEGEISDIMTGLVGIDKKIQFLEEQINIQGYSNDNVTEGGE